MKVLILSCSTGGGHNSCAKYIKEELLSNNIECEFKDFFDIVNVKAKDLSSKIYLSTLGNNGKIFKKVYTLGEMYSKTKLKSPVYLVNKLHKKSLLNYIKNNNFDLVITTHLFPALTLTAINKKVHTINFIMVATDYEPCPFIDETKPNKLVINKYLENRFIEKGIDKHILLKTGIPISTQFISNAKSIKKEFKITNERIILIMLGSMGFGKIDDIINDVLKIDNIKVFVVCGGNKDLYNDLSSIKNNKLIVLGYTNNINDLIYSSTIVLSKPGGLSTTEIASIRKPLIHLFKIPGIETYNTAFFENKNMSINCNTKDEIINSIKKLLDDDKLKQEMIDNQKKYINKDSAKDLVDYIIKNFNVK